MREVCQRRGVRRIAAVATAAVREAENGPWFVRRVRQELDIPLRIIDTETEAALSYRSVAHHFPLAGERAVVADIGGGSLELIGAVDGLVELTLSLPLGAVRLTELYLPGERTIQQGDGRPAETHPETAQARASPAGSGPRPPMIGSGGTFTNLGRDGPGPPRPARRATRCTASSVDDGGGGAAARVARQPDPGAAAAGAGPQPRARRHHPRRTGRHGRAARLGRGRGASR